MKRGKTADSYTDTRKWHKINGKRKFALKQTISVFIERYTFRHLTVIIRNKCVYSWQWNAFNLYAYNWSVSLHLPPLNFPKGNSPQQTFVIKWIKSNPITGLDRPWGFQQVEAPRFQDNRHMKMISLSALRTGRLYPPANIRGTYFC